MRKLTYVIVRDDGYNSYYVSKDTSDYTESISSAACFDSYEEAYRETQFDEKVHHVYV